jgi:transmembrane sensor
MTQTTTRQAENAPENDLLARHRDELKKRFPLPAPAKKTKHSPLTLSVVIAALGFAGGLIWLDPAYRSEHYSSAAGQVHSVELVDGSIITLDGSSQIDVSWHLRSRRVELQSGQALFDVAPASYRPFLTRAGSTEIVVVGTRYNVSRLADDVRITVEEGKVDVRGQGNNVLLTPGKQVLVHNGQVGKPIKIDAESLIGWTEGRLVFDRTPLIEVLDAVRRHRGTSVRLADAGLAQFPVSGTFDSANLDSLLALLPKVLPLELSTAADGTLSLSHRPPEK